MSPGDGLATVLSPLHDRRTGNSSGIRSALAAEGDQLSSSVVHTDKAWSSSSSSVMQCTTPKGVS